MKSFVVAAAAAVCLLTLPVAAGARDASGAIQVAQADINVRIGSDRPHHRQHWRRSHAECKTITVRERHGNRVVVKKIKKC
jgi:hypothetical protein